MGGLGTRRGTGRGAEEGEGTPATPAAVIVIVEVEVVGWGRRREPILVRWEGTSSILALLWSRREKKKVF